LAEYRVVVGDDDPVPGRTPVYRLQARDPFVSRKREDAFWLHIGDEVALAAADDDLPFESVLLFLKKARGAPGKTVTLYRLGEEFSGES